MTSKNVQISRSKVAQGRRIKYYWVAAVTLIAALAGSSFLAAPPARASSQPSTGLPLGLLPARSDSVSAPVELTLDRYYAQLNVPVVTASAARMRWPGTTPN
jgi:hypothetical protein